MCNMITIPSLAWLSRAVWRWCARSSGSAAVPAGHVAVCEGARFVVRLAHLGHPAFLELLRQAEEEYGFASTSGPVALPPATRIASATSSTASPRPPTPTMSVTPPSAAATSETRGRFSRDWPGRSSLYE